MHLLSMLANCFSLHRPGDGEPRIALVCPRCTSRLEADPLAATFAVCGHCGNHLPVSARDRIDHLLDPGSFNEVARLLGPSDPLHFTDRQPYTERLRQARVASGSREAVIVGTGRIGGCKLALGVFEFGFLGGSLGSAAGERLVQLFERAHDQRLPTVILTTSGGVRLQEGLVGLFQMAKTVVALRRFQRAGLPLITVLANPTTGGVYASVASLGDVILAEPGAFANFAGPRVAAELTGALVTDDQFAAERLFALGLIDSIVDRRSLRDTLLQLLSLLTMPGRADAGQTWSTGRQHCPCTGLEAELDEALAHPDDTRVAGSGEDATHDATSTNGALGTTSAWSKVQLARAPERPSGSHYVARLVDGFVELRGDRVTGDDPTFVTGVGRLAGRSVAIVAQDRASGERWNHAAGFRKTVRVFRLASRLGLPIVTLIDALGAEPGTSDAELGVAPAIAECLAVLADAPVPVVAAVVGDGNSGAALALALADRIVMQEHAIFTPMAPEGAATVLLRDSARAQEVAEQLRLTATDGYARGLIDRIVPEPLGTAAANPDAAAAILRLILADELQMLARRRGLSLVHRRYKRYRRVGAYRSPATVAIQELGAVAAHLARRGPAFVRRAVHVVSRPFRSWRTAA